MSRSKRLGVLAAVAAAVALASGCGGSDEGTIPATAADSLNSELTAAQTACAQGDTAGVAEHAQTFVTLVNNLPEAAGADLKAALRDGGRDLEGLANSDDCPGPAFGTSDTGNGTPPPSTSTTTSSTTTSSSTTTTTTKSNPSTGGQPPGQDSGTGGTGAGKR